MSAWPCGVLLASMGTWGTSCSYLLSSAMEIWLSISAGCRNLAIREDDGVLGVEAEKVEQGGVARAVGERGDALSDGAV